MAVIALLVASCLAALTWLAPAADQSAGAGPGVGGRVAARDGDGARRLPSKAAWLSDVRRSMHGSLAHLRARDARARPGARLAVNLDIDNTALATKYAPGRPVLPVRRFAREADRLGMKVFFNTGRTHRKPALKLLRRAGFPVDRLCTRHRGERVTHSKQRCRHAFVVAGYTIVANVGNTRPDFLGHDYERAFRLPSYHGRLG
jgi:hypothetical protein